MKKAEFITLWDGVDKIKVFEIPVIDKRTNENDWIVFDISIVGRSFIAQHIGLTTKQERSKKIAHVKMVIDLDRSIDENLQNLFCLCELAIIESEFFTLND